MPRPQDQSARRTEASQKAVTEVIEVADDPKPTLPQLLAARQKCRARRSQIQAHIGGVADKEHFDALGALVERLSVLSM